MSNLLLRAACANGDPSNEDNIMISELTIIVSTHLVLFRKRVQVKNSRADQHFGDSITMVFNRPVQGPNIAAVHQLNMIGVIAEKIRYFSDI
jgi:hypothetical protein